MPVTAGLRNTRRDFLKVIGGTTSVLLAKSVFSRGLSGQTPGGGTVSPSDIRSADVRELVQRGVDVARASGATYADVRLTRHRGRQWGSSPGTTEVEKQMVGVRALVNGYWGFASGALWQPEAVVLVAREAVNLAKANSLGQTRVLDLAPASVISNEHWEMPVEIDPFTVQMGEMRDFLAGMRASYNRLIQLHGIREKLSGSLRSGLRFLKLEKAFGSTDGSYGTQISYRSDGEFWQASKGLPVFRLDFLSPAGVGWELVAQHQIHDEIERAVLKLKEDLKLPVQHVDVGRYETVMDAESVAQFASGTLGLATELDRALGYEANAGGTSYLNMPFEMIGTFKVGPPVLRVTANRTVRGGVATTGWDDDGVKARDVTLVDRGILQTFQTTRESAGLLHQGLQRIPLESSGCACAITAGDEPITQSANIHLHSGEGSDDYQTMVQAIDKGIAFENLTVVPDFQQLSGIALNGGAYEIRKGKKTAMLAGAGLLFRAPELWNSITAVGGSASVRRFGTAFQKGQPLQLGYHSVTTPTMAYKDMTVIDVMRKS